MKQYKQEKIPLVAPIALSRALFPLSPAFVNSKVDLIPMIQASSFHLLLIQLKPEGSVESIAWRGRAGGKPKRQLIQRKK